MKYKAIIFDLDGVICHTDAYHYLAWKALADRLGIYFDKEINNRLRGVSRMESLEIILERYEGTPLLEEEKIQYAKEKNNIYRVLLKKMSPKDLSDDLITAMARCDKVCKHIHLPLQSGSTKILTAMKRRYTKESYLNLVEKIKSKIPDISLTTDIIVGFPGETDEDFKDTLDVIKQVKFQGAFTFIYSKRTGTPAAAMTNQVDPAVIQERFNELMDVVDQVVFENMKQYENQTLEVLVERQNKNDPTILSGRTQYSTLVHFKGDPSLIGTYVNVHITEGKPYYTLGEIK